MATHDYVIDNSTGANVRSDINNALSAIVSNNSSDSEPGTKYAYMWWADTSNGILKIRNSANNGWVELLQLDGTLTLEDGTKTAPALANRSNLNTGIFFSAANTFNISTAGLERLELGTTTIFNEDGEDVDFRIESDSNVNMFFVDAGNNRIGIGTNSPSSSLEISVGDSGTTSSAGFNEFSIEGGNEDIGMCFLSPAANNRTQTIAFGDSNNNNAGKIQYNHSTDDLTLTASDNIILTGDAVGIGTSSPRTELDLATGQLAFSHRTDYSIRFYNGEGNNWSSIVNPRTADGTNGSELQFSTAQGIAMFMATDRKIGIGTTSPQKLLDVRGEFAISNSNTSYWNFNRDDTSGALKIQDTGTDTVSILTSGEVQIKHQAAGQTVLSCEALYDGASNTSVDIATFARQGGAVKSAIKYDDPSTSISIGTTTDHKFNLMTNDTTRMTIDTSGNVGIGVTTSPAASSTVEGVFLSGVGGAGSVFSSSVEPIVVNRMGTGGNDRNNIELRNNGTARGVIGSIGASDGIYLDGGTAGVDIKFGGAARIKTVSAGLSFHNLTAGTGNAFLKINSLTGAVFFDTSTILVKTNIENVPYGLDTINKLQPRIYERTDCNNEVELGFIAEEVIKLIPEIVPTGPKSIITKQESDTEIIPLNVDYQKLTAVLTKAVQELAAKVAALEAA